MEQLKLFNPESGALAPLEWRLCVDGASRNNPGLAGAGICLLRGEETVVATGYFLGIMTNNQAEYWALILGLEEALQRVGSGDQVIICSDSQLLIRQLLGEYRVKQHELRKLFDRVSTQLAHLKQLATVHLRHVPREENSCADSWANRGIDEKRPLPDGIEKGL